MGVVHGLVHHTENSRSNDAKVVRSRDAQWSAIILIPDPSYFKTSTTGDENGLRLESHEKLDTFLEVWALIYGLYKLQSTVCTI